MAREIRNVDKKFVNLIIDTGSIKNGSLNTVEYLYACTAKLLVSGLLDIEAVTFRKKKTKKKLHSNVQTIIAVEEI